MGCRLERYNKLLQNSCNLLHTFPSTPDIYEPIQLTEEWKITDHNIVFSKEVPGIDIKEDLPKTTLRSLTTNMLETIYNPNKWTHIYTDGSANPTTKTGGSGIVIIHPNGHTTSNSLLVGSATTSHKAELIAIQEATSLISKLTPSDDHIVILTDSRSCLEGLMSPRDNLERETLDKLNTLSLRSTLALRTARK